MSELLDYTAEEMTGMSLYALCHGEDVHKLKNTHEDRKIFLFGKILKNIRAFQNSFSLQF